MKRLHIFAALLAALLLITACEDDNSHLKNKDANKQLNLNRNDVTQNPLLGRLEMPRVKGGNTTIISHSTTDKQGVNYTVEWDIDKKAQRWTAYQMSKAYKGNAGYDGNFEEDPDLPAAYRLADTYSYYRGSGFTRGHICPSADRQYSKTANHQTFYYTNMQPQYYAFNAGNNYSSPWCRLENLIRTWASASTTDTLYVVKGGTIEDNQLMMKIKNELRVPKYFFVALLMKNKMGYRAIGFWMEHDNKDHGSDPLSDYAVNISNLERLTGIDFFCNLPDDEEHQLENVDIESAKTAWGRLQ